MTHPIVALPAGAALLGAALLLFSITRLLTVLKDSVVARLPAVAEQDVDFAQVGVFVLHLEQPRLDTALDQATFSLRDAAGRDAPSSPSIFRTTRSGLSTTSISVRNFSVEHPGRYHFIVKGIPSGRDLSRCALVFTRPFAVELALWILGLVLGGAGLIGGGVMASLYFAGKLQ